MLDNPLLTDWTDGDELVLPPFDRIDWSHYEAAFETALHEHRREVDAVASASEAPTFENTVVAFDKAGRMLARLEGLFQNLTTSHTSPELQAVERALAPRLAEHESGLFLNRALFDRVRLLHANRASMSLDGEQRRMLERLHLDFVRAGALLEGDARDRLTAIRSELAVLATQFSQRVLASENAWVLPLPTPAEQAGLPAFVMDAAREAARERGLDAPVVTLARSSVVPFLTFSTRRDLREKLWRAWTTRGEHDGETDTRAIVRDTLRLRAEMASLLGYANYAEYSTADKMAGTTTAVMRLLDDVWARALPALERERDMLKAYQWRDGGPSAPPAPIEPWDWRWLAERVRQSTFAIDDAEVKAYFPLERMVDAAFDCAERLFAVRFKRRDNAVTYHPDVVVYDVLDAKSHAPVGVFLHDLFARPTKRSGAWMNSYRRQSRSAGRVLPIVVNNCNFNKAPEGVATLLSFDDVRTLFHEFGHGLHGLLSNVSFDRLSGTNVLWDFVELPSQLFEHWALVPSVLQKHARHVHTNERIPDALVERLKQAARFGQAYETVRYVASALTDMAVHSLPVGRTPLTPQAVVAFEEAVLRERGLPSGVGLNHRFTHFQHLFAGDGYAAGYYVYLWAEVLDEDAFEAFEASGDAFDPALARKLLRHIYSSGNSVEPQEAYRAFRGRDARVEPMLASRGLLSDRRVTS